MSSRCWVRVPERTRAEKVPSCFCSRQRLRIRPYLPREPGGWSSRTRSGISSPFCSVYVNSIGVASFLSGRFAFLGFTEGPDPRSQQDGQVLSYVNDQIRRRYQKMTPKPLGVFFYKIGFERARW